MAKIIKELKIFGEDIYGNFTGMFSEGDYVVIKALSNTYDCKIENIYDDIVEIEIDDYEYLNISIDDIDEIVSSQ